MKKQPLKKHTVKKAVGIDISSTFVSLALLRLDPKGIHLVNAVRRPIPEGLLKGGKIENPKLLREIVRDLKRKCGRTRATTLSLFSSRSLVQIMELPDNNALNMGQHVQKEIKNYVNMTGVKTVIDYRGLESMDASKRMFAAAGDVKTVSDAVNACQAVGLDVQSVEPNLLAYVRALYHKRVADRFGCNVLLAIMRDEQMCLAVLRGRNLDYISTDNITEIKDDSEQAAGHLVKKIKRVMQYYDVEVPEHSGRWELNVVLDESCSFSEQAKTVVCEAMGENTVDWISSENVITHCSVSISDKIPQTQISISAIGHAMRSLSDDIQVPDVNLLPRQIAEANNVKRGLLLTAIAAATFLLIMGLFSIGLVVMSNALIDRIAIKKPDSSVSEVVQVRGEVESQIEEVGKIPMLLKEIIESKENINWAGVLSDIRRGKPNGLCLTSLDSRPDYSVFIEGQALAYNDITVFVARLSQSDHIASANLNKSVQRGRFKGHYVYGIRCQLKTAAGI